MSLPHRFPFRLVETPRGPRACVRLSGTSYWLRGSGEVGPGLLAEMMAQGAALLLGDPGSPVRPTCCWPGWKGKFYVGDAVKIMFYMGKMTYDAGIKKIS